MKIEEEYTIRGFYRKIIRLEKVEEEFTIEDSKEPFVIPTETVYGLAARIDSDYAIKKIFEIKGRPSDNPLIVHISSLDMLDLLIEGEIPNEYKRLMEVFWPGPLSLVFKANKTISKCICGEGSDTVAIRMPKNPMLLRLIDKIGVPLAAPSANRSGRPSPTSVQHSIEDLGDKVSVYVDGGVCEIGIESTVVGMVESMPVILRPGGVTLEALEEVLGRRVGLRNTIQLNEKVMCPGQKYKHYSPSVPVYLFKGEDWVEDMKRVGKELEGKLIGLMGTGDMRNKVCVAKYYNLGDDKKECSRHIFRGLIELEKTCDVIFIKAFSLEDEGLAIMDRINRATTTIIE